MEVHSQLFPNVIVHQHRHQPHHHLTTFYEISCYPAILRTKHLHTISYCPSIQSPNPIYHLFRCISRTIVWSISISKPRNTHSKRSHNERIDLEQKAGDGEGDDEREIPRCIVSTPIHSHGVKLYEGTDCYPVLCHLKMPVGSDVLKLDTEIVPCYRRRL